MAPHHTIAGVPDLNSIMLYLALRQPRPACIVENSTTNTPSPKCLLIPNIAHLAYKPTHRPLYYLIYPILFHPHVGHIPSPPYAPYSSSTANHCTNTVPNRASIVPTPTPTVMNIKRLPPTHPKHIFNFPLHRLPAHQHIPPYHTYPVCKIELNHNTHN